MAKQICITVDFDDTLPWTECYRRLRNLMDGAEGEERIIEGWESSDFDWFNEHGNRLTEERISDIRMRVNKLI